jgi:diguanylate cyclase (GGDEF)-like protein
MSWNFPDVICDPVLYHHEPEKAGESYRPSAQTVYYAGQLAEIYNGEVGAEKARLIQQVLTEQFDVSEADAIELLDNVATRSEEMLESFDFESGEIKPYSFLLQEANKELAKLNMSNEQMILELQEAKRKTETMANNLRDANNRLKELVYRDGLTGLYNHRFFQEALSNEISRASRYHSSVSLILFDIDFFKKVNDTYGHPAGDLVLMNIAKAVNSAVRPCDIVARYGGEEFAVILPETSAAGVKVFAARLRRCVEGIATLVDGQLIYVTVSAGATTFDQNCEGVTKSMLIEAADCGLYASKQNGRNQVTVQNPEQSMA